MMIKLLILFLLLSVNAYATLTNGVVSVVKNAAANPPTVQNGSITDTGTSSGTGNVGIGSATPGVQLDVQGTVRVLGSWNVGLGTTSPKQALNVNGAVSMSGGESNASQTDPMNDWNAAGSTATTTGTISSSSNSLVVASAAGYNVGMGISVANAGTAGTAPLISYITDISGTTFTLNDNAVTTATTQTVKHDDTRAIVFAVGEACFDNKNVHIHQTASCYPVSSVINVPCSTHIFGDGARGDNVAQKGEIATGNGTCIQNEGKTNDVFDVPTGNTIISDLAIQQDTTVTPTAGFAISIGIGSTREFSQRVSNVNIFGTYEGISIGPKVTGYWLSQNHVRTITEPLYMNNADPSGDSYITDNYFGETVATDTNLGSYFTCASINSIANNKFIDGNPPVKIDGAACASIGLRFENNSIENATGSNGLVQIVGGANGVTGLTFTGGEIGSDGGFGGVTISGSANASFNHVTYSDITGTVFTSSSSGTVENFDPILSNGSSPTGNFLAGNVGIGSINPNTPLDINTTQTYNGATIAAKLNTGSLYTKSAWNNGSGLLVPDVVEDSGGNARSILAIDTNNPPNTFINTPSNTSIRFITGGSTAGTPILAVTAAGNIGIGSLTPGQRLDVQGTARFSGSILLSGITSDSGKTDATICEDTTNHQFYSGSGTLGICLGTSTKEAKQNIQPISEGINEIMSLKPVSFNYREGWGFDPKKSYYGFLAEDVRKIFPRLVGYDANGKTKSADYVGMIPVMVKAIQELQKEIDDLVNEKLRGTQ